MYTYITSGTYYFLKQVMEKNPNEKILMMQNAETSQIWHETKGSTVFQSPRKYEVILAVGPLENKGFAAVNHIPVREEGRPVFEYNFTESMKKAESFPGFKAIRVLRPLTNDSYIVMTIWQNEDAYHVWKKSPAFADAHKNVSALESVKSHSVFSGPSYVKLFVLGDEELDDSK
ncbi:antibiotic biosynthesis monooxygenase family protein [Siminovitchia sediminis]|uniref:Antibiotic biosynthesis monooxygenase family protein n=1 Tax=Siminovitchia sediminis TaxID=1274353 RepID=A0ABW4KMB2_9BACI